MNASSLTGDLFIAGARIATSTALTARDPATNAVLGPNFSAAGPKEIRGACAAAERAFGEFASIDYQRRAQFLETISEEILGLGDALLERAHLETALPLARLAGERMRTINQLRLFADELRAGYWLGVRIDTPQPDRTPVPRPELKQMQRPIGPVAIFSASNFPLAFSVAGGDTVAALAAGCPVIVKGHPAHLGTSELVASAIVAAIKAAVLPEGVFSLLNGDSKELGAALVADPAIKAVGFTGSRTAGLALTRIAAERPVPIPVYAEMSSVNPSVLCPDALDKRADMLAEEFCASLTLGVGQFCTNPGLVFLIDSPVGARFIAAAVARLESVSPGTMLTSSIHAAYQAAVEHMQTKSYVTAAAYGLEANGGNLGRVALFTVTAIDYLRHSHLADEIFGPAALIVRCNDEAQLQEALDTLEGQLTASLHMDEADTALATRLFRTLENKAGRLLVNGWPTGVEVSHAMVHGGPFPATSDARSTSVGTLAINRFLRPICYQNVPDSLLPSVLRSSVVNEIPHRRDGTCRG